jgi:hypothetical protein
MFLLFAAGTDEPFGPTSLLQRGLTLFLGVTELPDDIPDWNLIRLKALIGSGSCVLLEQTP